MRLAVLVAVFGGFLSAQRAGFQEREELNIQQRVDRLEERFSARSEDVKNMTDDLNSLKTEIKTVREQAIAAKTLSESNRDRLDQITWIGRLILGAVAFLIGVIVTQFVSKFMATRRPRMVRTTS
jgi:septal ring factor EnvC (AmiA/AmiB activator)